MVRKNVLIVEDEAQVRKALCEGLGDRGFEVYGAGRVAEARKLAEEHWDVLDVIVLDIELDDLEEKDKTGVDLGIELRRERWHASSPEFIIYSKFDKSDYYRQAGKLRAVAYLEKTKHSDPDLFRHVKVLALSHALNSENDEMINQMDRIAAHSDNASEAISQFCRNILMPEMEKCLGTPFIILFSDEERTYSCAGSAELPEECDSLYPLLQDYVHGKKNMPEPFIFEADQLNKQFDPDTAALAEKLHLAAFVPLPVHQHFRLSIGILQQKVGDDTLDLEVAKKLGDVEDATALGLVLAEYLRPTALENMLKILPRWAALKATLSNTAKLCLVVGQEMKYLLPVQDQDEFSWPEDSLRQLWDLADDLNDTGQLLRELEASRWEGKSEHISIKEVAETSWRLLTQAENDSEKGFKIEGDDCFVEADRRDLEIAVSRLLHWLAQRRAATPRGQEPLVTVKCRDDVAGATITFEDKSQRLSKKLREEMFDTFSQAVPVPLTSGPSQTSGSGATTTKREEAKLQGRYLPLFLAKMLVEGRYHGTLEDRSDDEDMQDRSYGHRIVMHFPPNRKAE
jgi:DNA-binding NarL/FixJ family response regulator